MAHFKAVALGYRNKVATIGNKMTGLLLRADAIQDGVMVKAIFDTKLEKNVYEIYSTRGKADNSFSLVTRFIGSGEVVKSRRSRKAVVIAKPRRKRRSSIEVLREKLAKAEAKQQEAAAVVVQEQPAIQPQDQQQAA